MRRLILVLGVVAALPACASLPDATGQLRVTEAGVDGAYPLIGSGAADGCIVSVVGELPAGLEVTYAGARCAVELR